MGGAIGIAGVLGVVAQAVTTTAYDATAKITPGLYYINDRVGSVYTFTVTNTGSSTSIGAVEVKRPSTIWAVSGCAPPPGWTSQLSVDKCRYRSAASSSDDIKPGQSKVFKVGAKTAAGNINRVGTWPVNVSKTNHFDTPSAMRGARATGSGLTTTLYTFELTTAVVTDGPRTPGSACPAANKDAVVGATKTVVACGRNRANVALTPISQYSSMSGTFVKTPGSFSSGVIQPNSGNVVLAQWNNTVVSDTFGSGKKVVVQVGSWSNRTSPLRTFTGYNATSSPPVAVNDVANGPEDTAIVVAAPGVLANDTDAEGDPLTAVDASDPAHGTVTLAPDGSYTYTPDANFNGTDSFTYKAFDTYTKSGSATVTVTVNPVNDLPVGVADAQDVGEDSGAVTVPVLANDSDVDGDTLSVDSVNTTGTQGKVTNNGTNVSYDPKGKFEGLNDGETATDTFTYDVTDGSGLVTVTVTMTIVGDNDDPVAANDTASTTEDAATAPISVLANDDDVEGPLTLTGVPATTAKGGTVTDNGNGTVTYSPNAKFEALGNGQSDTDSFTYTVTDNGGETDSATVTITVNGVNDAPIGTDDAQTLAENAADTNVTVLANDTDAEGQALSVSSVDVTGTTGTVTNHGTHVSYDPNGQFAHLGTGQTATDTFTYTVTDTQSGSDSAVVVTITVSGVNGSPNAVNDAYSTDEATQIGPLAVLVNDTDDEGAVTAGGLDTTGTKGSVTDNGDGTFTYDPNGAFEALAAGQSDTDSFAYTVTDAGGATDTATVTITVNGINDAPVGNDDAATIGEDASGTTVSVLANDTDAESQALDVSAVDVTGTIGAVTNHGTHVSYDPNGQFSYLGTGQTATDTFTYTVRDAQGATDTAVVVTVTISGGNDAPVARDDAYSTDEATQIGPLSVLANDSDAEGAVTITAIGAPSNGGTVTNNNDGTVTFNPAGAFEDLAAGQSDTTSFTYTVTDAQGATDTATVTVTVNGINDAPVGVDDAANVGENDSVATNVPVLSNDTDAESQALDVSSVDVTGTTGAVTNHGTHVSYDPSGAFEYLDDTETATDTFTYTVRDAQGATDTATVTVTVSGANDAPMAGDDGPFQTFTDTNITLTAPGVLANDLDNDGEALTAGNASDPAHGTVTLNPNGSFSYTPDSGYNGTDSFTYDVSDGTATDSGTVTINVVSPNAKPTVDATSGSGNEDGGAITVTLTGHDADGDALTFTAGTATNGLVTVPSGLSCDANTPRTCTATVTYTPNPNFNGTDSFTYTANDGTIDSTPATATVTVNAVNDAPSFTKGANQTVNEDAAAQSVSGWATAISAGPANESAQAVSFTTTNGNNGLFAVQPAVSPSGELTYTLAPNASGVATVTVKVTDDGGTANGGVAESAPQTFTITVTAVNDAPSFTKGADQTVNEDAGAQSVSNWASAISKGPADESTQTLSFTTSNDNNALFSTQPGVTPTGTLTYTPAPNAVGSATVTISLSDTGGTANGGDDTSDSQTFTITVGPVNDAPSFTTAGNRTVNEDAGAQTVNGFVTSTSAGPADESAQTVTVAVVSNDNNALFSAQPSITNGTLTYTPAANANGLATVTVQATDDGGTANGGANTSPTQTFTITVNAVNDAPSFTKGANQTLNEDAGAQSVSNWASAISKGPADESGQTLSFSTSNDNNGLFSVQPGVSPTGTLTYTSAANKYGTATVTVSLSDNGGTANGGDDSSDSQTFTITVNPVNDAPVAAAKSYAVQTNMKRSLTGLLGGATDPNDVAGDAAWSPTFTVGSITAGANCVGCTISNVDNAAGTFDFEPPAGQTGTFSVTYTVVDSGHPAPGVASAPQTITFNVSGDVIWFVDGTNGDDTSGSGTLTRPYKTLAAAAAVDSTNHRVFVHSGTYTGAFTLTSGEWLAGSGAKAPSFDSLFGIAPPAGTVARPAVNGTNPTIAGAVTLGSGNTLRGVRLTGATALAGTSFGTLTLGNNGAATTDVELSSTGQALSLNTGTINGDFVSTTSTGGTDNVNLTNVQTTTATSLGSGALSGATDDALEISGQNGTFSYAGTLTNAAAGDALAVLSKTGGTVTVSGAVIDTAGTGITLTNNTGSVIGVTGGVTLNTGAGNAFTATGGGTVTVTGAANTITSTTGTALNIANTTIGAADVTFRSISSNGAAKGIVLDNTGSSGNLNVTGNGGTCTIANTSGCSGGTISNATGGDDSGTSPVGTGIVLNNTLAPSFTRMNVNNTSNYGIRGANVNGLMLDTVALTGTHGGTTAAAAGAPYNEGGMLFDNLTGTVTFTAVQATGGHAGNIEINNTTGTLNATMSSLLLGTNSTAEGNDSLQVDGTGTSVVNVTVQNSTFTGARGDVFQYNGSGSGGALTFTGNTLTNNHPAIATGGGGVTLSGGAGGNVTMNVSNNTMRDSLTHALLIVKNPGSGSVTGTVNGNTIGVAGVANSGSAEGSGIKIQHAGTGTMSFAVTNNAVRQYNNTAIDFQAGAGVVASGTFSNAISGNTISNPGSNPAFAGVPRHGIQINSGVTAGDSFVTCADFGANSVTGSGAEGGVDVRVRHRQSTTVKLPGYAGAQYDTNAVNAFVLGKVGGGANVVSATSSTGGGFVGTAC